PAVLAAQQVLEQDLERERQPRRARAEHVEAMDQELRAADLEDASGVKAVSGARHAGTIYGSGVPFHGGSRRFDVYMEAPMTVEGATVSLRADAPALLAACPGRDARERRAPNRPLGRRCLPDLRQRR